MVEVEVVVGVAVVVGVGVGGEVVVGVGVGVVVVVVVRKRGAVNWHDVNFVAVDPGLRGCGVAIFTRGTLMRAAYVKNSMESGRGYAAHAAMADAVDKWMTTREPLNTSDIIIEFPQIYGASTSKKGDDNDLLDLAGVGGAIASMFNTMRILSPHPRDWKGQVPKETMTERIRRALSDTERANIEKCPASLMHNVLDAAGIGLWQLGRLNKKVYPHAD